MFTDPPYDRAAIPRSMAMPPGKRRILKPCGSMISYCGNLILPEALPLMMSHLKYFWICAVVHSEKDNEIFRLGIKNGWKPLLWFVKQHRGDVQTFVRDAVSGGREKDHHEWQQATSEAEHFITGLTAPNGIVVDFFAGGGTTLVAAEKLGRRWLAFEIDEMAVRASWPEWDDRPLTAEAEA